MSELNSASVEPAMKSGKKKSGWVFSKLPIQVMKSNLSAKARLAYAVLAYFGKNMFPTHKTIAEMMGVHVSTAIRALKELKAKGWIEIEPRFNRDGDRSSNRYSFLQLPTGKGGGQKEQTGRIQSTDLPSGGTQPAKQVEQPVVAERPNISPNEIKTNQITPYGPK